MFQVISFREDPRRNTAGTGTDVEDVFRLRPQAEYTASLYYGKAWDARDDNWRLLLLNPLLALIVKKAELNSIGREAQALALVLQHGVAHVQPQLLAPDWAVEQGWFKS